MSRLTCDDLTRLGTALYGSRTGWKTRLAAGLDVSYNALSVVFSQNRPVPRGWEADFRRLELVLKERDKFAPAPAGVLPPTERLSACHAAMTPPLDAMLKLALRAGWRPGEVHRAVLAWAALHLTKGDS
jgi:hypothetical protein